jgi:hypothetical protein
MMLMIPTPGLVAKKFDLNLCDEASRKLFSDRLVDRLLVWWINRFVVSWFSAEVLKKMTITFWGNPLKG